jgi:PAS domain S-box-containing protein
LRAQRSNPECLHGEGLDCFGRFAPRNDELSWTSTELDQHGNLTVDTSGIILAWSHEAQALLGYTEAEALGRSIELIMPAHLRPRHHAGFARFVQTGVTTLPEVTTSPMIHKNGETHRLQISVKAVRDSNQKIVAVEAMIRPHDSN